MVSKRKLKILYLAHEGHMGGASKSLAVLAGLMKEKGHQVTVVIPFGNSEIEKELKKKEIETIVQFYTWWQYPANEKKWIQWAYRVGYRFNPIFQAQLYRKLKGRTFDIVHTNSSVLDIGMSLSRKLGAKHIWHFREFGESDLGTRYIRGRKKSMSLVNQNTDRVIFISKAMEAYYTRWISKKKSCVIYNGIGAEYLCEKEPMEEGQEIRFLISGALQQGKGQACAIDAVQILKRRGYKNFKLIIAGRDIAGYGEKLQEKVRRDGLTDLVVFQGFVKDMKSLRKSCQVELVCSKREAFGRVTVEAMMSSNPVIATNAGANPELIREGVTGFLYTLENAEELAEAMICMLEDPERIFKMGKNAYRVASTSYTAEQNADAIEALYEQLQRGERKQ
jgi:glycosyltransferase involved in cell wall biosynthesis